MTRLLPVRRPGGRGAEPGAARAHRRAGGRLQHGRQLRARPSSSPPRFARIAGVGDVFIPQDIDYPALQLDIDRTRAAELGLSQQEVVGQRHHRADLQQHDRAQLLDRSQDRQRLHADRAVSRNARSRIWTTCAPFPFAATSSRSPRASTPSADIRQHQVAHRSGSLPAAARDRHLRAARWAKIWAASPAASTASSRDTKIPDGVTVTLRGMVQGMRADRSRSFGIGLIAVGGAALPDSGGAVPVVHRSVPDSAGGSAGTHRRPADALSHRHHAERDVADGHRDAGRASTVSNSILIVEFTRHLREDGHAGARGRGRRPAGCGCGRC